MNLPATGRRRTSSSHDPLPRSEGRPLGLHQSHEQPTTNFPARREIEDVLNRSDRRWASPTKPRWRSIGSDHVIGMEPRRAVRIWARTAQRITRSLRQGCPYSGSPFSVSAPPPTTRHALKRNSTRLGDERKPSTASGVAVEGQAPPPQDCRLDLCLMQGSTPGLQRKPQGCARSCPSRISGPSFSLPRVVSRSADTNSVLTRRTQASQPTFKSLAVGEVLDVNCVDGSKLAIGPPCAEIMRGCLLARSHVHSNSKRPARRSVIQF